MIDQSILIEPIRQENLPVQQPGPMRRKEFLEGVVIATNAGK